MEQKVLNRMLKYCKSTGLSLGQLISNLIAANDPFYVSDKELEKLFNQYFLKYKPPHKSGGYYPKGHKKTPQS